MIASREFCLYILTVLLSATAGYGAQQLQLGPNGPGVSDVFAYSGPGPDWSARVPELGYDNSPLRYFPVGVFERNPQLSAYKENWYSQFLFAMAEPSLLPVAKSTDPGSYRFLLVLNHRALSFRLVLNADGTGNLTTKSVLISDGKITLSVKRSVAVSAPQVLDFLLLLQKVRFWSAQPEQLGEKNRYQLDNAEWVLEGVTSHQYHVIDRWAPRDPDFIRTGAFLMLLAHPGQ